MQGTRAPPQIIGRYAVYDEIARGGMATIHIGRLVGEVGFTRTVAIKRLHPHLAKEADFVNMLVDEARVTTRIRHANVVQTLDVVVTAEELLLVMEYIEGESLSQLIRQSTRNGKRVSPPLGASMMTGVLRGLHAAHEARSEQGERLEIVHRDVSPQNVIVGVDGVARLLDFGVAKAAGRLTTTREGQLKGKIPYMAPEQLQGQGVSRQSDVFAAAAVLWEVLVGQRLFKGSDEGQLLHNLLQMPIAPPGSLVEGLPPGLDEVVLRGLERDPAARYSTALAMADALEAAIRPSASGQVGAWVSETARGQLEPRAQQIRDIESSSTIDAAPTIASVRASILEARADPPPDPVAPLASATDELRGDISIVPVTPSGEPSAAAPVRSRSVPLLVATLSAFACGVALLAARAPTSPAGRAPSRSAEPAGSGSPDAPPASVEAQAAPFDLRASPGPAGSGETAPSSPARPSAAPPRARPSASASTGATPPRKKPRSGADDFLTRD